MLLVVPGAALADRRAADRPPEPIRIRVAASKGQIIPQSRGGGGFQRTFRFTATPGRSNHWIKQVLEVRGTVFDARGRSKDAHLDVIEYYRVDSSGKTIQHDSHYSQFHDFCGGDLTISSTLTYGTLRPIKLGDTILGKTFILRSCRDAEGKRVTMKTRTTRRTIPAERGKRVEFQAAPASIPTRYTYRVKWNACPGHGSRTRPSGEMDVGTWRIETPKQVGRTVATMPARPIPRLRASGSD